MLTEIPGNQDLGLSPTEREVEAPNLTVESISTETLEKSLENKDVLEKPFNSSDMGAFEISFLFDDCSLSYGDFGGFIPTTNAGENKNLPPHSVETQYGKHLDVEGPPRVSADCSSGTIQLRDFLGDGPIPLVIAENLFGLNVIEYPTSMLNPIEYQDCRGTNREDVSVTLYAGEQSPAVISESKFSSEPDLADESISVRADDQSSYSPVLVDDDFEILTDIDSFPEPDQENLLRIVEQLRNADSMTVDSIGTNVIMFNAAELQSIGISTTGGTSNTSNPGSVGKNNRFHPYNNVANSKSEQQPAAQRICQKTFVIPGNQMNSQHLGTESQSQSLCIPADQRNHPTQPSRNPWQPIPNHPPPYDNQVPFYNCGTPFSGNSIQNPGYCPQYPYFYGNHPEFYSHPLLYPYEPYPGSFHPYGEGFHPYVGGPPRGYQPYGQPKSRRRYKLSEQLRTSGYIEFGKEVRDRSDRPLIMAEVATMWRNLSAEEKEEYNTRARNSRQGTR